MNDQLILKGLIFYGHHGCIPAEQVLGQRIGVDVELSLDLKKAAQSDNVEMTVDYSRVYKLIESIVKDKQFNLMEALAEDIAQSLLNEFKNVRRIDLEVRKLYIPVDGSMDWMGIRIRREQEET